MASSSENSNKRVIIIGGNISGLSTALKLAEKNIPTALYETHIWDKPCGGGFGVHFAKMLQNNYNIDIPFRYVHGLVIANRWKRVEVLIPLAIISRRKLQAALIEKLREKKSLELHLGEKLNFNDNFDTFQDINVVATGTSGFSRQALGKSLSYVGMFQYQLVQSQGDVENFDATIFYFLPKEQGYAWLFPAPEGKIDIGVGGLAKGVNWDKELIKFVDWLNYTYGFKIKLAKKSRSWGIPVPINKPGKIARRYNKKLFVGVGDAIELPDAATAAGIEAGWMSGQLIGEAIMSPTALDLQKYVHDLQKELHDIHITNFVSRFEARLVRHKIMFPLLFALTPSLILKLLYNNPNT